MKFTPRLLILASIVGLLLAAFVGIGIYGLIAGPPDALPLAEEESSAPPRPLPSEIPAISDPEAFASAVLTALFDWDTTRLSSPEPITELVMTVADPSGYESAGLYSDLARYLPTREQWVKLREYETRQQLTDITLTRPKAWDAAAADPVNEIVEGTVALTVDATRVREGGWHGEDTRDESAVEFTMFLACPPATEQCALLRLSALGSTLR